MKLNLSGNRNTSGTDTCKPSWDRKIYFSIQAVRQAHETKDWRNNTPAKFRKVTNDLSLERRFVTLQKKNYIYINGATSTWRTKKNKRSHVFSSNWMWLFWMTNVKLDLMDPLNCRMSKMYDELNCLKFWKCFQLLS